MAADHTSYRGGSASPAQKELSEYLSNAAEFPIQPSERLAIAASHLALAAKELPHAMEAQNMLNGLSKSGATKAIMDSFDSNPKHPLPALRLAQAIHNLSQAAEQLPHALGAHQMLRSLEPLFDADMGTIQQHARQSSPPLDNPSSLGTLNPVAPPSGPGPLAHYYPLRDDTAPTLSPCVPVDEVAAVARMQSIPLSQPMSATPTPQVSMPRAHAPGGDRDALAQTIPIQPAAAYDPQTRSPATTAGGGNGTAPRPLGTHSPPGDDDSVPFNDHEGLEAALRHAGASVTPLHPATPSPGRGAAGRGGSPSTVATTPAAAAVGIPQLPSLAATTLPSGHLFDTTQHTMPPRREDVPHAASVPDGNLMDVTQHTLPPDGAAAAALGDTVTTAPPPGLGGMSRLDTLDLVQVDSVQGLLTSPPLQSASVRKASGVSTACPPGDLRAVDTLDVAQMHALQQHMLRLQPQPSIAFTTVPSHGDLMDVTTVLIPGVARAASVPGSQPPSSAVGAGALRPAQSLAATAVPSGDLGPHASLMQPQQPREGPSGGVAGTGGAGADGANAAPLALKPSASTLPDYVAAAVTDCYDAADSQCPSARTPRSPLQQQHRGAQSAPAPVPQLQAVVSPQPQQPTGPPLFVPGRAPPPPPAAGDESLSAAAPGPPTSSSRAQSSSALTQSQNTLPHGATSLREQDWARATEALPQQIAVQLQQLRQLQEINELKAQIMEGLERDQMREQQQQQQQQMYAQQQQQQPPSPAVTATTPTPAAAHYGGRYGMPGLQAPLFDPPKLQPINVCRPGTLLSSAQLPAPRMGTPQTGGRRIMTPVSPDAAQPMATPPPPAAAGGWSAQMPRPATPQYTPQHGGGAGPVPATVSTGARGAAAAYPVAPNDAVYERDEGVFPTRERSAGRGGSPARVPAHAPAEAEVDVADDESLPPPPGMEEGREADLAPASQARSQRSAPDAELHTITTRMDQLDRDRRQLDGLMHNMSTLAALPPSQVNQQMLNTMQAHIDHLKTGLLQAAAAASVSPARSNISYARANAVGAGVFADPAGMIPL